MGEIKKQSFSSLVKDEIASNEYDTNQLKAILSSYLRLNANVFLKDGNYFLEAKTQNSKIAKFVYQSLIKLFDADIHFQFLKANQKRKHTLYKIEIKSKVLDIIDELQINFLDVKGSKNLINNNKTFSSYLGGVFLSSGSINSPNTSNYHLELSISDTNFALWLYKIICNFKGTTLEAKMITRRNKNVIYFKKSDQISSFLALIGAVETCMNFENIRVDRDYINSQNRLNNFDTANMARTLKTGQRQKEEILYLKDKLGENFLNNDKGKLLMNLRIENESSSLDELALKMSKVLKKNVSKSNVNHLFRLIHNIYEKEK